MRRIPDFKPDASITLKNVTTTPLTDVRWTLFCPSAMSPLHKQVAFPAQTRRRVLLQAKTPPTAPLLVWLIGWLYCIPRIGKWAGILPLVWWHWTYFEDVADACARAIEREDFVGEKVAPVAQWGWT